MENDRRVTLKGEGVSEITVSKSVFLGHALPVKSEKEAIEFIDRVSREHYDAKHNVYAYAVSNGDNVMIMRSSDNGEPQGTAGIPVLDVIRKGGFTDAVIVVTRYFGGILLGAGGLVRAYTAAASAAAENAGIAVYESFSEFSLKCGYSEYNRILPLLEKFPVKNDGCDYADGVKIRLAVRSDEAEKLFLALKEMSAGRIIPAVTGKRFDII